MMSKTCSAACSPRRLRALRSTRSGRLLTSVLSANSSAVGWLLSVSVGSLGVTSLGGTSGCTWSSSSSNSQMMRPGLARLVCMAHQNLRTRSRGTLMLSRKVSGPLVATSVSSSRTKSMWSSRLSACSSERMSVKLSSANSSRGERPISSREFSLTMRTDSAPLPAASSLRATSRPKLWMAPGMWIGSSSHRCSASPSRPVMMAWPPSVTTCLNRAVTWPPAVPASTWLLCTLRNDADPGDGGRSAGSDGGRLASPPSADRLEMMPAKTWAGSRGGVARRWRSAVADGSEGGASDEAAELTDWRRTSPK